jgi:hypothetical protein
VRVLLRATPTATRGTSVFKVISERSVILPSEWRPLCEGAITSYFELLTNVGLTQPAQAGLELMTYRLLSENTTINLQQPLKFCSFALTLIMSNCYW